MTASQANILWFALAAAPMALCGGCDRTTEAERALQEATVIVQTAGADRSRGPVRGELEQASTILQRLPQDASEATRATAALLHADVLQRLGTASLTDARGAASGAAALRAHARSLLRDYESEHARAEAIGAFDPAAQIERLRERAEELAEQEARQIEQRDDLLEQADELESQIAENDQKSAEARDRAARMRREAAAVSATRLAERGEAIREVVRRADDFELRAKQLRGRLDALQVEIANARASVQQRVLQQQLVADRIEELEAEEREAQKRAAEHRAAAAQTQESMRGALAELETLRGDRLTPASEEAISAFDRALSMTQRAARTFRGTAATARATASRRLAEAHHFAAEEAMEQQALFQRLADAEPTLDQAEAFATEAQEARSRVAEHLEQAASAYEEAAGELTSAAPRGVDREGLEAASAELDELARKARAELDAGRDGREQAESEEQANETE